MRIEDSKTNEQLKQALHDCPLTTKFLGLEDNQDAHTDALNRILTNTKPRFTELFTVAFFESENSNFFAEEVSLESQELILIGLIVVGYELTTKNYETKQLCLRLIYDDLYKQGYIRYETRDLPQELQQAYSEKEMLYREIEELNRSMQLDTFNSIIGNGNSLWFNNPRNQEMVRQHIEESGGISYVDENGEIQIDQEKYERVMKEFFSR